ncbi:hypothetical protein [Acidovorax sp. sic0104]|uniref:hypothetical protein n=1 Tax=Acidovorax sp. sic0104 TaxID=2854784 RepID=UPI001C4793C5|nr:hypothetical protein [Acidovorax sp. sic0104]MBV7542002.1 hypothetical protein [Acidovorax sp. sic0104]
MSLLADFFFWIATVSAPWKLPKRGSSVLAWMAWSLTSLVFLGALVCAGFIVFALGTGKFGEGVVAGTVISVTRGKTYEVRTDLATLSVEPSLGYGAGDEVYLQRLRTEGLRMCSEHGCWAARVVEATPEIREAVALWPQGAPPSN